MLNFKDAHLINNVFLKKDSVILLYQRCPQKDLASCDCTTQNKLSLLTKLHFNHSRRLSLKNKCEMHIRRL